MCIICVFSRQTTGFANSLACTVELLPKCDCQTVRLIVVKCYSFNQSFMLESTPYHLPSLEKFLRATDSLPPSCPSLFEGNVDLFERNVYFVFCVSCLVALLPSLSCCLNIPLNQQPSTSQLTPVQLLSRCEWNFNFVSVFHVYIPAPSCHPWRPLPPPHPLHLSHPLYHWPVQLLGWCTWNINCCIECCMLEHPLPPPLFPPFHPPPPLPFLPLSPPSPPLSLPPTPYLSTFPSPSPSPPHQITLLCHTPTTNGHLTVGLMWIMFSLFRASPLPLLHPLYLSRQFNYQPTY